MMVQYYKNLVAWRKRKAQITLSDREEKVLAFWVLNIKSTHWSHWALTFSLQKLKTKHTIKRNTTTPIKLIKSQKNITKADHQRRTPGHHYMLHRTEPPLPSILS